MIANVPALAEFKAKGYKGCLQMGHPDRRTNDTEDIYQSAAGYEAMIDDTVLIQLDGEQKEYTRQEVEQLLNV